MNVGRPPVVKQNRDTDWILAMAAALGLNSGFSVPIVPTQAAFERLFADIRAAERKKIGKIMAGSYSHLRVKKGGDFTFDPIDNLGDAYEAVEELIWMIRYLAADDQQRIKEAHAAGIRTNWNKHLVTNQKTN